MADIAISTLINKIVEIAANVIVEESSRLYWLQEDIHWLEQQMKLMQAYLQIAEVKKVDNPTVATFIKGIRNLAHDVEDILDTFLPPIEEHRSSGFLKRATHILSYGRSCSTFSKEIEKIKRRVEGIERDKKNYDIPDIVNLAVGGGESNVDHRTPTLHFDDHVIVGFDRDIAGLKSKLEHHQFVSVVGMGGLGKTTLAKKVFKSMKDDFDCSASVSVSQEPNIKALLQHIAKQVDLGKEKQEEDLEVNLHSFLQEKRYILFLDDIWRTEAWDRLKVCFPINSECASRIIITSRDTGVGRYISGENSVHQLNPFDYPTSWELFSKLIMPSSELKEVGEAIVKKCAGIPLAIVVTVGMLQERGMSEFGWNQVLKSIGQDTNDKCAQILGLSYADLPTVLKPCFLHFGVFPEDYEFSASELVKLWMAENFIRCVGGREPEDVGDDYLSKLDARNLIQVVKREHDGRVKKFRVHDLLYSLCLSIGRDIDFLNTSDHLADDATSSSRVRRLAVFQDVTLNYNTTPKIRALFHFELEKENQKKLKNMASKFRLLHVLKLETTSGDLFLPTGIGNLSRLNYLGLKAKFHRTIAIPWSIQKLKKLETLDIDCYRLKLPIGIWKMKQLRHLILDARWDRSLDYYVSQVRFQQVDEYCSSNIRTFFGIIGGELHPRMLLKLNNLKKLILWRVATKTMEMLCGLKPISKKLEILHCSAGSSYCILTELSLAQYDMLKKLRLANMELKTPVVLPPSLIKLTLENIDLLNETIMETLKNLPKLKILKLLGINSIQRLDWSGANDFPELQVLKLVGLSNLRGLGEDIGMPKLRQVIIRDCPRLETIPERLQQLRI